MAEVEGRRATCGYLVNYTSKGEKRLVFLQMYPIYTDGQVSHYLGVLNHATKSSPAPVPLDRPLINVAGHIAGGGGSVSSIGSGGGGRSLHSDHAGFRPAVLSGGGLIAHSTPLGMEAAAAAANNGKSSIGFTSSSTSGSSSMTDDMGRS